MLFGFRFLGGGCRRWGAVTGEVPHVPFDLIQSAFGEGTPPCDLAVIVVGVDLCNGECFGFPVDIRDDQRVLVIYQPNMVAYMQFLKGVKFRDRRICAESEVADEGSITEALRQITEIGKHFNHGTAVDIAEIVAVVAVRAGRIRYAQGFFGCFHVACADSAMIPITAVGKIGLQRGQPLCGRLFGDLCSGFKKRQIVFGECNVFCRGF